MNHSRKLLKRVIAIIYCRCGILLQWGEILHWQQAPIGRPRQRRMIIL